MSQLAPDDFREDDTCIYRVEFRRELYMYALVLRRRYCEAVSCGRHARPQQKKKNDRAYNSVSYGERRAASKPHSSEFVAAPVAIFPRSSYFRFFLLERFIKNLIVSSRFLLHYIPLHLNPTKLDFKLYLKVSKSWLHLCNICISVKRYPYLGILPRFEAFKISRRSLRL